MEVVMRHVVASVVVAAAVGIGVGCQSDKPTVKTAETGPVGAEAAQLARSQSVTQRNQSNLETFALFRGPMPTGVAVSHEGRVFVNYPRWGDPVEYTVAELKNGQAVPYPDLEMNKQEGKGPSDALVSVQSVVVDPRNRLWIVDTGSINFGPVKPGGAKLLCYDLATNRQVKRIDYPADVVLSTSYTNDVRFDMTRGTEGMAFITDSSDKGPNGIIVVDLATGKSWRRLNDHPSTKAEPNFAPIVEGEPLKARPPTGPEAYVRIGSDGIATDVKNRLLYYRPLIGRHLYSVSLDAISDPNADEQKVAGTVKDYGARDSCSDGLECDANGALYLTDYEHNAIRRFDPKGAADAVVVQDPRMIWPDSMAIGTDGYLYFTCNQLNRQKQFHKGKDLRQQPYVLFRVRTDSRPVVVR
jgi:sugar lactone lactonase YvrE